MWKNQKKKKRKWWIAFGTDKCKECRKKKVKKAGYSWKSDNKSEVGRAPW